MRSTRYLAGALVAAASIAVTSLLAIPVSASADVASCSDARATRDNAASVEQGTRGRLSAANSALNSARAQLGNAVSQDAIEDAITPDTAGSDKYDAAISDAQAAVNARVGDVSTAQSAENTALANLSAAETAVNTACNTPVPTTTPAPVGLPGPTTTPTIVYRYVGGKYCKCTNGNCVAVTPPGTVVIAPPTQTLVAPPPVTVPSSPVIIYPPAPSGSSFSQIGQAPAGAAPTGFGPNA